MKKKKSVIPGGVIFCASMESQVPFWIPLTETAVYSMEELCHYLYHHVFMLSRSLFTGEMADWIGQALQMEETAQKLRKAVEQKSSLKDIVVLLLCSVDYYTEEEIRSLLHLMGEIEQLSCAKQAKVRADCYLEGGNYQEAAERYRQVLQMEDAAEFSMEEYGEILHKMGICAINTGRFADADAAFLEAYKKNGREESLLAWLYYLGISRQEERLSEAFGEYQVQDVVQAQLMEDLERMRQEVRRLPICQKLEALFEQEASCFYTTGKMIGRWKEEFVEGHACPQTAVQHSNCTDRCFFGQQSMFGSRKEL